MQRYVGRIAAVAVSAVFGPNSLVLAQELAPSCASVTAAYDIKGSLEPGNLVVVEGQELRDADGFDFKPRGRPYDLYYVYQNAGCEARTCVERPILLIKTLKVTNYDAPEVVFLKRESQSSDWSVGKLDYDDFHKDTVRIPRQPYSSFHITYTSASGTQAHTQIPLDRRKLYLFGDLANTTHQPWLVARNYTFQRNNENKPQCIPLDIRVQAHTELSYIEVVEVESGLGGTPTVIGHWEVRPKSNPADN